MKDFTRVFDVLYYQLEKYPERQAINAYQDGRWQSWSIQELLTLVEQTAAYLQQQGFQRGDMLVLIPKSGHLAWVVLDFACQLLGVILVPVHATISASHLTYIFAETGARACLCHDRSLAELVTTAVADSSELTWFYHLQADADGFFDLLSLPPISDSLPAHSEQRGPDPETVFCILYTSGTTGVPKGVMLTHQNMVANIKSILALLPIHHQHRVYSFLPLSHIFERMAIYTYLAFGASIYFAYDREEMANDLVRIRPHFFTAVPRILEKFYELLLLEQQHSRPLRRRLIKWAMDLGEKYGDRHRLDMNYFIQLTLARWLVLAQIKKKMGGQLLGIFVGASALQPSIARIFSAAGIKVREGYGMTEASPVITTNRFEPGLNRFGTAGLPVPGVRLRIDQPDQDGIGEIQIQGPNVMQGYFQQVEKSAKVFTEDGWFKTGDLGKMVDQRFLKITGRLVDVYKTSAGKFVSPEALEQQLGHHNFIDDCFVVGFQRPYLTAIIVPHFYSLEQWCAQNDIHWTAPEYMVHNIRVLAFYETLIQEFNAGQPNYLRIKKFQLVADRWTVSNEMYGLTLKKVRKNLSAKYQKVIDKLYQI